jgi:hypothetical protein
MLGGQYLDIPQNPMM